jgi:hypothetical protein
MQISMRRTQPVHPRGLKGDDGNAQRAGAAGGANATPASSNKRCRVGGKKRVGPSASSPPHEPSDLHHDEGKAATGGNRSGGRRPRVARQQRHGLGL